MPGKITKKVNTSGNINLMTIKSLTQKWKKKSFNVFKVKYKIVFMIIKIDAPNLFEKNQYSLLIILSKIGIEVT